MAFKKQSVGGALIAGYDGEVALTIMELIADGKTLSEVVKLPGMPSRAAVYRWLNAYPDLARAYETARELSAQSFEEEALDMARKLKGENDFTNGKTRQYEVAMGQFRWSAARRDPKRFGQKMEASLVVPIQINTSLDMGSGEGGRMPETASSGDNVYSITAAVEGPDETADLAGEAFELPEVPEHVMPKAKGGRPTIASIKHKTADRTRATITRKATARKRKEQINGTDL